MKLFTRPEWLKRGSAVVEMAVVTPLLFALTFGIIEFGWEFTVRHTMVNAAREGCRVGIIQGKTNSDITSRVTQLLTPLNIQSKVTTAITGPTSTDPTITVTLTVPQSQISLVGNVIGMTFGTVKASCSMRVEGQ